jgi:hypothetical protein
MEALQEMLVSTPLFVMLGFSFFLNNANLRLGFELWFLKINLKYWEGGTCSTKSL